ncbi:MAG: PD40 domain-containing protein [Sedimentisphaerales bacterium]|nr:PD40 domain-containing protein [Sedimentisphaerales bacterium]
MTASKIIIAVVLIGCITSLCVATVSGPYMGQEPPGMKPEIFSPGFICLDNRYEYGFGFSPDGREFAFTLTNSTWGYFELLYTTMDANGQWAEPSRPEFVGDRIQSLYPFFTSDGNKVFFASPLYQSSPWNSDIFYSERTDNGWSEPVNMGAPINSTGMEFRLSMTDDGTIYFLSSRDGDGNIYRCPLEEGEYTTIEKLGTPINTTGPEGSPFIAPDESYLIFESGRADGYGQNDLYISFRNEDGSWGRAINLGPAVNTNAIEDGGSITRDGKYFLFCQRVAYTTNIQTDIYWMDARAVLPDPSGTIVNLTSGQRFGSIQCAVNYALPGEIIEIGLGSYSESVVIDKDIVIKSTDPNNMFYVGGTIINGDLDGPVLTLTITSSNTQITGLTIRAGNIGISGSGTNAEIFNCRIMDNITCGVELSRQSKPHILNCLITANGQTGIIMLPGSGRGNPPCEPIIENCIIVDNGQAAIIGGEPVIVDSLIEGQ